MFKAELWDPDEWASLFKEAGAKCELQYTVGNVHVLMRDEKEGRKKQARSNKQQGKSNTAYPRQSLFLRKMSCLVYV